MSKRFIIILVAFVAIFAGLIFINKREAGAPSEGDNGGDSSAQLSNHVVGQGTSGVTLTEWGDFACPACYQYFPLVKAVKEHYGDKIKFQFRNYPLTEIHQNALVSARAAEAANLQGKFWEMHDKLYETQPQWRDSSSPGATFEQFAQEFGLDLNKFKEDMKSDAVNDVVQADREEAQRLKYSSTPTFEIDGKQIEAPRDVQGFIKLIDEAIKEKSGQ